MLRARIAPRLEGALQRGKPPVRRPGVTITPPDGPTRGEAAGSPRSPGRYAVDDPHEAATMRLSKPGGRSDLPTGPRLPTQFGLDHPVQNEPTLGDLQALDVDAHAPRSRPPSRPTTPPGLAQTLGGIALVGVFGAVGVLLAALWVSRGASESDVEAPVAVAQGPKLDPAPPLVVEPPPKPPPAPVVAPKAQPAPAVAARPAPKPARPAPKPAPKSAPKPPPEPVAAVAALVVRGDAMVVELQGEFGGFRAGTPIPPGEYQVWADFGGGLVDTGSRVTAVAGGKIVATCDAADQLCSILH